MEKLIYKPFGTFRFALAMLVVFQHFGCNIASGSIEYLASYLLTGTVAVLVFFALSGFIISEAAVILYSGRPLAFIANRAIRILVPFWLAVLVTWGMYLIFLAIGAKVVSSTGGTPPAFAFSYASLSQNLFYLWPGFVWPLKTDPIEFHYLIVFWAVRYEILFYLICALAIFVSSAFNRPVIRFALSTVFVYFILLLLSLHAFGAHTQSSFKLALAQFFSIGSLAYFASVQRKLRPILFISFFVVISAYPLIQPSGSAQIVAFQTALLGTLLLTAWWLSTIVIDPKHEKIDAALGDLSYPIYLFHLPVQIFAKTLLGDARSNSAALACLIVTLALSFGFSRWLDPGLQSLRNKIRGRRISRQNAVTDEGVHASGLICERS